jgi:hypothetical protein
VGASGPSADAKGHRPTLGSTASPSTVLDGSWMVDACRYVGCFGQ